jgi:hypothetical protein
MLSKVFEARVQFHTLGLGERRASGTAAMLSQISSTSFIRSGMVSSNTSAMETLLMARRVVAQEKNLKLQGIRGAQAEALRLRWR